jgi:hypothetical protein
MIKPLTSSSSLRSLLLVSGGEAVLTLICYMLLCFYSANLVVQVNIARSKETGKSIQKKSSLAIHHRGGCQRIFNTAWQSPVLESLLLHLLE